VGSTLRPRKRGASCGKPSFSESKAWRSVPLEAASSAGAKWGNFSPQRFVWQATFSIS